MMILSNCFLVSFFKGSSKIHTRKGIAHAKEMWTDTLHENGTHTHTIPQSLKLRRTKLRRQIFTIELGVKKGV